MKKNKKSLAAFSKKAVSILLIASMSMSLAACGENNDAKESKITTAEKLGTEEPVTVTTGFVEPDIDIDPGAVITTTETEAQTTTETETVTETETETETSTEAQQPQGKYTYTIYGDITISMDINVDDYIIVSDEGQSILSLYRLASDLGWLSLGKYGKDEVAASDDPKVYAPDWWSYSNGTLWTVISPSYYGDIMGNEKAGYDNHQISNYYIQFSTIGEVKPYYSHDERTSDPNHNDVSIDIGRHYPDATYLITGYKTLASRDDIVLLAYLFWYMPQHCGEASSLCEQLSVNGWGQGGHANIIKLP